jgi:hypothetical protein
MHMCVEDKQVRFAIAVSIGEQSNRHCREQLVHARVRSTLLVYLLFVLHCRLL